VIAASIVQSKWVDAQKLIFNNVHNTSGRTEELVVNLPNLMDHARVVSVDGNTVVLGVEQKLYMDKLMDKTRIAWVERAISRVTDTPLRVRYVLLSEVDSAGNAPAANHDMADDPLIQEAIGLGGQLREDEE
jgi:hypothetical protein